MRHMHTISNRNFVSCTCFPERVPLVSHVSALNILTANSDLHLTSVDIGEHGYVAGAAQYLDSKFPNRHTLVVEDSVVALPALLRALTTTEAASEYRPDGTTRTVNRSAVEPFDAIFIDGGHAYEVAAADITNSAKLAKAGTIVVMDDVVGSPNSVSAYWTDGPTRAWEDAIQAGLVVEIAKIESSEEFVGFGEVVRAHGRAKHSVEITAGARGMFGFAYGFFTGHLSVPVDVAERARKKRVADNCDLYVKLPVIENNLTYSLCWDSQTTSVAEVAEKFCSDHAIKAIEAVTVESCIFNVEVYLEAKLAEHMAGRGGSTTGAVLELAQN